MFEASLKNSYMNEPKRHLLVPRCYLKKFGTNKKKEWFVYAYDKISKGTPFSVNVKNICVETEYYTIEGLPEKQKRVIEKFYADNVEQEYNLVYEALVNEHLESLSKRLKYAIIRFIVSQYLRTSKLTNSFNKFWSDMIERGFQNINPEEGINEIHLEGGETISFEGKTLDQVQKEQAKLNQEHINSSNIERIIDLTERRVKNKIQILKMHPSMKLITSDNPVEFGEFIYDPNVFVRMPLNQDYLLTLIPTEKGESYNPNRVSYSTLNEEESWMLGNFNNQFQIKNCEKFIVGSQQNIEKALDFSKNLDIDAFEKQCKKITEKQKSVMSFLEALTKVQ